MWRFVFFPCCAFLCIAVYYVLWRPLSLVYFYRRQGLRGTTFKPLIGDLLTLSARRKLSFFDWFTPWDEEFGSMYWFFLGTSFRLRICSPALANEVLVTHASAFTKTALLRSTVSKRTPLPQHAKTHRKNRPNSQS
jgi:hypothetical protein